MFRPALLTLAWLVVGSVTQVKAARPRSFCSDVSRYVTQRHEQVAATSFCSSYLSLSPRSATETVTSTQTTTITDTTTVTTTTLALASVTATATSTTTTDVTTTDTVTVTQPTSVVVAETTVYSTTYSSTDTTTSTVHETVLIQGATTTIPLTNCASPTNLAKRTLGREAGKYRQPKPPCFSMFIDKELSKACSCLSISQPTSTSTDTVTTTSTAFALVTDTFTQTNYFTVTGTTYETVTTTATVTTTSTITTTVSSGITETIITATTTTITDTATTTEMDTVTATPTRYSNFALLESTNKLYGQTQFISSFGDGIYFDISNLAKAASFSFGSSELYYAEQYITSYQPMPYSFYAVVNRPMSSYGYPTTCTLTMNGGLNGCPIKCYVGDGGTGLSGGYANNDDLNNGAWGFRGAQGTADEFTVYAVGQT